MEVKRAGKEKLPGLPTNTGERSPVRSPAGKISSIPAAAEARTETVPSAASLSFPHCPSLPTRGFPSFLHQKHGTGERGKVR